MIRFIRPGGVSAAVAGVVLACLAGSAAAADADAPADVDRGEYVFRAAAGCSCHTDVPNDGPRLAGGRALETPFGTFYSPNITPDPDTGIGDWTADDFMRAMKQGVSPAGEHYYPVFPYTSYTRMSGADLRDLWAYLSAQEPIERANREHDIPWLLSWRSLLYFWKWWYLDTEATATDPAKPDQWNRGAYLVNGAAHCGECHTPRTWLGGLDMSLTMAGTAEGPEGELAPNITPDPETGIGRWRPADLTWLLQTGLLPDGDSVQGPMAEAIDQGYQFLSAEDRQAIAEYMLSLPPTHHRIE